MYTVMFYGGLILAIASLILSIVLFVKNDVAKLLADITGWSSKTAVKKMKKDKASETAKQAKRVSDKKIGEKKAVTSDPIENIFQSEEDMMVLAGESTDSEKPVSEISEVLRGGPIQLPDSEGDEVDGILFGKGKQTMPRKKRRITLAGEATDVLGEGERITDLLENIETDVLPYGNKETDVLDTSTDILDKATDLLQENRATDVLWENKNSEFEEDEDTNEDTTDVLCAESDEDEADSEESEITEVLCADSKGSTEILTSDDKSMNLLNEEQPLPDIFDVQDNATVVHTKDKI